MCFDNDLLAVDEMVRVKRIVEDPKGGRIERAWSALVRKLFMPKAEGLRRQALAGMLFATQASRSSSSLFPV